MISHLCHIGRYYGYGQPIIFTTQTGVVITLAHVRWNLENHLNTGRRDRSWMYAHGAVSFYHSFVKKKPGNYPSAWPQFSYPGIKKDDDGMKRAMKHIYDAIYKEKLTAANQLRDRILTGQVPEMTSALNQLELLRLAIVFLFRLCGNQATLLLPTEEVVRARIGQSLLDRVEQKNFHVGGKPGLASWFIEEDVNATPPIAGQSNHSVVEKIDAYDGELAHALYYSDHCFVREALELRRRELILLQKESAIRGQQRKMLCLSEK